MSVLIRLTRACRTTIRTLASGIFRSSPAAGGSKGVGWHTRHAVSLRTTTWNSVTLGKSTRRARLTFLPRRRREEQGRVRSRSLAPQRTTIWTSSFRVAVVVAPTTRRTLWDRTLPVSRTTSRRISRKSRSSYGGTRRTLYNLCRSLHVITFRWGS